MMTSNMFDRPRLTVAEAAAYLAVSPRSLSDRGWRYRMGIPTLKLGRSVRFDRAALDRWLQRQQERRSRDYLDIVNPALVDGGMERGGAR